MKKQNGTIEVDILALMQQAIQSSQPIYEQAFYGPVKFPAWENASGKVGVNKGGNVFVCVTGKRKFSNQINTFFKELTVYLKNNSIFKGKPVVVTWDNQRQDIDLSITDLKENKRIMLNDGERLTVDNFIIDQLCETGKRTFLKYLLPIGLWLLIFSTVIAYSCSRKLQPKQSAHGNVKPTSIHF